MKGVRKGGILQNFFFAKSEKEMKRQVDILRSIVERNKIRNSDANIDNVIASVRNQNVKYKIYY